MKRCKLVLGQMWGGRDLKQEVNIPDDVYFYDAETIGHGSKTNANYYCTVIKTEDYKDWLKYLKKRNRWGWDFDTIGEYTVITIRIVYKDKHNLPIKSKEEVFKGINFHRYVFVYYDKNFRCVNVRRIFNFDNAYYVNVGYVTFRDFMSFNPSLTIQSGTTELHDMFPAKWDQIYSKYEVFDGVEAETIWNTAIKRVLSSQFNYNPNMVDTTHNFDAEYDEWMAKYKKSYTDIIEDLRFATIEEILEETEKAEKDIQKIKGVFV